MSSTKQREELQAAIWKIANDVRGAVDGWDFKQFVLGIVLSARILLILSKVAMRACNTLSCPTVLLPLK